MKSAYERAMERFGGDDDGNLKPLTDEQRQRLAEIDKKWKAKIAEREIFLQQKIVEARINADFAAIEDLERQLHNERLRLQEEAEQEKNKVRAAG